MKNHIFLFFLLLLINKSEALLQNTIALFQVNISYTRSADGLTTDFVLTSNIGNINPSSAWLGVGFNNIIGMVRISLKIKT